MNERCFVVDIANDAVQEGIVELVDKSGGHEVALEHDITVVLVDLLVGKFGVAIDDSHKALVGTDITDHKGVFHFLDFGILVANSLPE